HALETESLKTFNPEATQSQNNHLPGLLRLSLPWQSWAFIAGMLVYLLTRLINIDQFPIYFFCDEAIQTMSAFDLIRNGFKDPMGNFLPAYFQNGGQYNLGLSVYWQMIPALLQRSVIITRGFAALVTLVFPLSLAFALKDIFKFKYWWLAPLVVSAIPTWFLHSRTAFETTLGASMFALFLYFYLKYRLQNRKFLYLSLLFGALAFYAYTPMQMVMLVSGLLLLVIDFRYHWQDKATLFKGLLLLGLLAAPDLWFRQTHQEAIKQHLNLLHSYILEPTLSIGQKLLYFLGRYLRGFDPSYWFLYNKQDLVRHLMLGWGHMPSLFFPFVALGVWQAFKRWPKPENRVLLVAFFAAPTGAALVEPSITRLMMMVVPFAYLTCLGMGWLLEFVQSKTNSLKPVLVSLVVLLALSSGWMTYDSLHNGPTWYTDYTLYGMQWGGKQVFGEIKDQLAVDPQARVVITPSWANNTDVIGRFFLGDSLPVKFNSINSFISNLLPIGEKTIFVLTPEEVDNLQKSGKFKPPEILNILNWPDGRPGFYFIKLAYVDNVEAVFEQEAVELRKPMNDTIPLLGQDVPVEFSRIDLGKIISAFDNDERSVTRTLQANPFVIKLEFPVPVKISQVTSTIGSPATQITVVITRPDGSQVEYQASVEQLSQSIRQLPVVFGKVEDVSKLTISILSIDEKEPAHVHVWEISFEQ
ncbi:MAG TPA: hypothetical protein VLR89_03765, partial [Anaerolineaceae bacterium]|nr:hypothetical protein [Anaerolineaceae bacterium]